MSAAAAKLLQSCPTLCDPIDGSPLGSSAPGILQARTLEWVAISLLSNNSPLISVQFSHSVMSDSLRPHELQHARPPCPSPTPRVHPNSCPLSWWCHPTKSPSPPALYLSQHQGLFKRVSSSHQVAKVLEFQIQHQSFQWIFRTDVL